MTLRKQALIDEPNDAIRNGREKSSSSNVPLRTLSPLGLLIKRAWDIVGAITFFVIFGPVYAAVCLGTKISMGSPAHYWQIRIGLGGQRFKFYKLRTMVVNSDAVLESYLSVNQDARNEWDTFQKLDRDPRITPWGAFMRRLSLDELPQFWNVLVGDMSLVGPRPITERQRELYGNSFEQYCLMRPGLTGLWQTSGRNSLSFAQRVELDRVYAQDWSLWLDMKILLKTVRIVIHG